MSVFAAHLLLALGWAAIQGSFTSGTLAAGFALGWVALWVVRPLYGPTDYFGKLRDVAGLIVFFAAELVASSLRVAHDVLTPAHRSRPGVLGVPLDAQTPLEITLVANLVTLTPGTLSLDVSDDRRTLWVHAMFIDDPDAVRRALKEGMEQRVLGVTR
jgi:multicomponent Na+:H+ antiporter subunit E